jgi:hypothetical protein
MSESRVRENRMHGSIGGRWPNRETGQPAAYLTVFGRQRVSDRILKAFGLSFRENQSIRSSPIATMPLDELIGVEVVSLSQPLPKLIIDLIGTG